MSLAFVSGCWRRANDWLLYAPLSEKSTPFLRFLFYFLLIIFFFILDSTLGECLSVELIITTLQKGGLLWGYKPMRKAGASRRSPSLMFRRIAFAALTQPHKGAKLWLPCKRIFVFSHTQLIYCLRTYALLPHLDQPCLHSNLLPKTFYCQICISS